MFGKLRKSGEGHILKNIQKEIGVVKITFSQKFKFKFKNIYYKKNVVLVNLRIIVKLKTDIDIIKLVF